LDDEYSFPVSDECANSNCLVFTREGRWSRHAREYLVQVVIGDGDEVVV
jgi:hypothetical protein